MTKRNNILGKVAKVAHKIKPNLVDATNLPLEFRILKYKRQLQKKPYTSTSWSDRDVYKDFCAVAAKHEDIFTMFKSYRSYREILENVSMETGRDCLQIIRNEGKNFLKYFDKFMQNDSVGNPVRYRYDFGKASPTTLRYIKVLVDLFNRFGNLNDFRIVEIGGGYGGQCKIIADVFQFKSYTIFDLDEILQLTGKYLDRMQVDNVFYKTLRDADTSDSYDLIISNCAFSECRKSIQDEYIDRILLKANRGYLTCNFDRETDDPNKPYAKKYLMKRMLKRHDPEIIDEVPKTGYMNFIMVWDDTIKG